MVKVEANKPDKPWYYTGHNKQPTNQYIKPLSSTIATWPFSSNIIFDKEQAHDDGVPVLQHRPTCCC